MGVPITVWGLLLKKRCDAPQIVQEVLSCDVTFSHDGDGWMTAAENLEVSYPDGMTSVLWLQHPISGRYWRIHPLTWVSQVSMRADLMGTNVTRLDSHTMIPWIHLPKLLLSDTCAGKTGNVLFIRLWTRLLFRYTKEFRKRNSGQSRV